MESKSRQSEARFLVPDVCKHSEKKQLDTHSEVPGGD